MTAGLALTLVAGHLGLVFGVQEVRQRLRTGESTWVDPTRKAPLERAADALFVVATLLVLLAPVLVLAGVLEPAFDLVAVQAASAVLIVLATLFAQRAQRTMGTAWRTGVADRQSSHLVVGGAFGVVRNPVYTALLLTAAGAALLVPTLVAVAGAAAFVAALELQTRGVEEPHLRQVHGDAYVRYAGRVGRFLPGVGRLRAHAADERTRSG